MLHEKEINVDVLILGGGLSGLMTAYFLQEKNVSTALIDKNKMVNQSLPSYYEIDKDLSQLSEIVKEKELYDVFKMSIDALYCLDDMTSKLKDSCDYKRGPKYIENPTTKEKEIGFTIYPNLIHYCSNAQINLKKLNHELYQYLNEKCPMIENKEIYELNLDKDVIEVVLEDKTTIKCDKVMVASGVDGLRYFDRPYNLKNKQNLEYKYQLMKEKKVQYLFNNNDLVENNKISYITSEEEFSNVYFNIDLSNGFMYSLMGAIFLTDKYLGNKTIEFEVFK